MKFQMVWRIREARIFSGKKEISNKEAMRLINTLKRKRTHNGPKVDNWMKELGFRKEYRTVRTNTGSYTRYLWWARE